MHLIFYDYTMHPSICRYSQAFSWRKGGDEREMSIASDDIDDLVDITPDEEK